METKEFVKQIKLLLSSLFARSMTHVVFGCPGLKDNELIFSNVDYINIEIYESIPEFFFHLVTIKDQEFLNELFKRFPLLQSHLVLLKAREFMSGINKCTKELDSAKLSLMGQDLVFECNGIEIECGQLISEYTATHYYDIFKSGIPEGEEPFEMELTAEHINTTGISYIDICNHSAGSLQSVFQTKCMLLQGKSVISIKEFIAKAKLDSYTLKLRAGGAKETLKVVTELDCPILNVISTQPGMRYYSTK